MLFNVTKEKITEIKQETTYTAKDIEVLEGLEPVRKRPGMYIGGVDEKALYHLISEVLDNSMDEAIAGYASLIFVHLNADNSLEISDNGRGIPVDMHPKFKKKSALEVIMTTLHSGGKFNDKAYATAGGLHGVGISVVNALSDRLVVEVCRGGNKYRQEYSRGLPKSTLDIVETEVKTKGTKVLFHPDGLIFPVNKYDPLKVYRMLCSKAYLFKGVTIEWSCAQEFIEQGSLAPQHEKIHFPNGLRDFIESVVPAESMFLNQSFAGEAVFPDKIGRVEWVITWISVGEGFTRSYCNTINTVQGGAHEQGFRNAIIKGIKNYAEIIDNKRASIITSDDIIETSAAIISIFIRNPSFQGQTKEKLLNTEATKLVENAVKHSFEHWLASDPKNSSVLIDMLVEEAENRLKRKKSKEVSRKNPIKSLRLPGKLVDCASKDKKGTELFLVEGDSAGGSAKQARFRDFQAVLPLKGKILNVASNSLEKIKANQEISDLTLALGVGVKDKYRDDQLRYEKIIIMTDADVDGAHITSLLLTFFYQQMPELIHNGHLYLAQPPLFKITHNNQSSYVLNEKEKDVLMAKLKGKRGSVEIGRFKGLGEMSAEQLKETTMDPKKRILLKVIIDNNSTEQLDTLVDNLMGKNPEMRFKFIRDRAEVDGARLSELIDF